MESGSRATPDGQPGFSRRQLLRYAGGLGAALAFSASVTACATASGDRKKHISAGISYALSGGFDPLTASSATVMATNLHVFEGLVDLHPATRKPYAALARELPSRVDERTYRATVRDGAVFHDGTAVTAEDVAHSFQRVMDPKNSSLLAQFIGFIDSVEPVDDRTVQFRLKQPFPLFSERISCIKIVPKSLTSAGGTGFNAHPVGSGPFRFVRALKDNRIEFEANRDYNGAYPATVDTMTWYLMSDAAARVTAQDSDRVQAIEDVPYLDATWLKDRSDLEQVPSFGLLFLMFNLRKKPFDDVRVRQALHYGQDTQRIVDRGLLGNGTPATSFFQESHADYVRASTVYDYDPEKAERLLREAGVRNLDFTLFTTDTSWVKDVIPLVAESWNRIEGVSVRIKSMQSGALYSQQVDTGDYEVCAAPGDPSVFGNDADLLLSWWYRGKTWADKRFHWAGTPSHTRLIEEMDASTRTSDRGEALEHWQRAVDVAAEQAALYPIFHRKLPTAWHGDELKNFQPLPTTGLSFLGVERI